MRNIIAKFRLSSHNLEIEEGRYIKPHKIPVNERFCQLCNYGLIEDEIHFVLVCESYNDIRELFFSKISSLINNFYNLENGAKIKALLASKNHTILVWFAKFLKCCFQRRAFLMVEIERVKLFKELPFHFN